MNQIKKKKKKIPINTFHKKQEPLQFYHHFLIGLQNFNKYLIIE